MNLLFTVDHKFIKPLCVLLYSIKKNTKENNNIYLPFFVDDHFTDKEKQMIKKSCKKHDTIIYIELPTKAKICASDKDRWGYQIWNKLTCLYYLPSDVKKILFIDSDCIIDDDIDKFYKIDVTNYAFFGVEEKDESSKKRVHFSINQKYICVGFLIINTMLVKKIIPTLDDLLIEIRKFPFEMTFDEQDFINYHFKEHIQCTQSRCWNFFATWSKKAEGEKIVVYHYAGIIKPWECYQKQYSLYNFYIYWKYGIHVFGIRKFFAIIVKAFFSKSNIK